MEELLKILKAARMTFSDFKYVAIVNIKGREIMDEGHVINTISTRDALNYKVYSGKRGRLLCREYYDNGLKCMARFAGKGLPYCDDVLKVLAKTHYKKIKAHIEAQEV